ncbi:hypothetical protein MKW94_020584 [Papaver nudicaule]|uniref:ALA-interacting subunit n=1 Tax=Papaver nudicaule TaxID=74823 RepID=A0AA41UZ87_PAPNU|nr:hypothetical protein [Papaver nudicaule]
MASSSSSASSSAVGDAQPRRRTKQNSERTDDSSCILEELPDLRRRTPLRAISALAVIGVLFITIGVVCLRASRSIVEIVDRYDQECVPPQYQEDKVAYVRDARISKTCIRTLKVPKDMQKPVNVYYELDNFLQNNHSRSDSQLRDPSKQHDTSSCRPEDVTGDKDKQTNPIVPCGLIAWSLFNDTYIFSLGNNKKLEVNKTGISWKSDRNRRFSDRVFPKNFQNGTVQGGAHLNSSIPLSRQEDLIVWMRVAAFPTFRKLYGRIEEDLRAGDTIVVSIQNNYNTYSFKGKKKLVLSTTSWLEVKNDFLGIAYLTVGSLCLFLAVFPGTSTYLSSQDMGNENDRTYLVCRSVARLD